MRTVIEFFGRNPSTQWAYGDHDFIDGEGRRLSSRYVAAVDYRELYWGNRYLPQEAVFFRRDLYFTVGEINPNLPLTMDYDLWLRMVEQGPIANIAEPLIYYRIHPEQATVRKLHQQVWGVIAAQHAARQRRAGRPDPLDGVAEITEATIRSFGVAPDESVAMAAAFEDRVATHLLLSQRPQALSYADSIQASADAIQWRTLFRPRLEWQLAVDAIRHRQPLAAVRHTIAALRSQPQLLLRLPARLLAGIRTIGGGKP